MLFLVWAKVHTCNILSSHDQSFSWLCTSTRHPSYLSRFVPHPYPRPVGRLEVHAWDRLAFGAFGAEPVDQRGEIPQQASEAAKEDHDACIKST